jgi:hypothetical protein
LLCRNAHAYMREKYSNTDCFDESSFTGHIGAGEEEEM